MAAVGDLLGLDSPGVPAPGAESVAGSASSGSDGAADRPSTGAQDLDEQSDAQISYLYHEPQLSSLCGVHALNNLLQGPYFGAGDLAEVGARIDATEARLLHGSAYTDRPLSARHVDAYSGDFSIEVSHLRAQHVAVWRFALRSHHPRAR
jgi:ataxin-3